MTSTNNSESLLELENGEFEKSLETDITNYPGRPITHNRLILLPTRAYGWQDSILTVS